MLAALSLGMDLSHSLLHSFSGELIQSHDFNTIYNVSLMYISKADIHFSLYLIDVSIWIYNKELRFHMTCIPQPSTLGVPTANVLRLIIAPSTQVLKIKQQNLLFSSPSPHLLSMSKTCHLVQNPSGTSESLFISSASITVQATLGSHLNQLQWLYLFCTFNSPQPLYILQSSQSLA